MYACSWPSTIIKYAAMLLYLQVETVRFLQNAVDAAYKQGVILYNTGVLKQYLSPQEAIGNYIDPLVRGELQSMFASYGISYGPRSDVTVNNRDLSRVIESQMQELEIYRTTGRSLPRRSVARAKFVIIFVLNRRCAR